MGGDRSDKERPELSRTAMKVVLEARSPLLERVPAAFEGWVAVGRSIVIAGNIGRAVLLLAGRIRLGQAILVHQLMMPMRAEGFAEVPSVGPR
jgi:hypothetical protein